MILSFIIIFSSYLQLLLQCCFWSTSLWSFFLTFSLKWFQFIFFCLKYHRSFISVNIKRFNGVKFCVTRIQLLFTLMYRTDSYELNGKIEVQIICSLDLLVETLGNRFLIFRLFSTAVDIHIIISIKSISVLLIFFHILI